MGEGSYCFAAELRIVGVQRLVILGLTGNGKSNFGICEKLFLRKWFFIRVKTFSITKLEMSMLIKGKAHDKTWTGQDW